jgi:uncharacterized cysteine cluster protein YcgN (CxxCxxCC family)
MKVDCCPGCGACCISSRITQEVAQSDDWDKCAVASQTGLCSWQARRARPV